MDRACPLAGRWRMQVGWDCRLRASASRDCTPTGRAALWCAIAKKAARKSKFRCRSGSMGRPAMDVRSPEPIHVLVADDEAPARQRLIDLLAKDTQVEALAEAADGEAAVEAIEKKRPDLVFLDVQMPELDGLGVIDAIGAAEMPLTVFVTAYDQHAIRAFEANALDYLLKPFSDERFEATMARAKARLDERIIGEFGQRV